eukprot:scaffold107446_cov69-Phaeocystis_antarctica.AAC.3
MRADASGKLERSGWVSIAALMYVARTCTHGAQDAKPRISSSGRGSAEEASPRSARERMGRDSKTRRGGTQLAGTGSRLNNSRDS